MPENLPEAAVLAGAGVAVVFVALSILMLAIIVLSRLSPGKKTSENMGITAPKMTQRQSPSEESIAAMAVAMALAMQEQRTVSTAEHDEAPAPQSVGNAWTTAGRARLMRARTNTGHRWRRG